MKRQLMVYAAIAAFTLPTLAPLSAVAQERGDRGHDDLAQAPQRDRGRPGGHRAAQAPDTPAPAPRPERQGERSEPAPDWRPSRGDSPQDRANRAGGGVDRAQGRAPERPSGSGAREGRPDRPDGSWNSGGDRSGWNRPDRDRPRTHDEIVQERANRAGGGVDRANGQAPSRPDRPDWNNGGRPDRDRPGAGRPGQGRDRDRDRQRQDYRDRFDSQRWQRDWNRSRGYSWWRNDRRFRGWSGVRIGFYFAPGYGYYRVPSQYYHRTYYVGQYLPEIFWRYRMDDYRTYGLGYPPVGARWVYVDNSVYLIDEYDGYIIDVIRDFWRW